MTGKHESWPFKNAWICEGFHTLQVRAVRRLQFKARVLMTQKRHPAAPLCGYPLVRSLVQRHTKRTGPLATANQYVLVNTWHQPYAPPPCHTPAIRPTPMPYPTGETGLAAAQGKHCITCSLIPGGGDHLDLKAAILPSANENCHVNIHNAVVHTQ